MSSQIIKRGIQTASTKLAGHGTAATAGHASKYCQICDCIILIFQKNWKQIPWKASSCTNNH